MTRPATYRHVERRVWVRPGDRVMGPLWARLRRLVGPGVQEHVVERVVHPVREAVEEGAAKVLRENI